jgi:hypothetical protein
LTPCHEQLQPLLKDRPFQEHAAATGKAAQADVGAEAGDPPVGAAAGMGPAEPDHIIEVDLERRD